MWESWMWAKQASAPFVHVLLLIRWSSERHFAWSVWSNQAGRCWPGFSYRPGNQVKSIVHLRCQGQRLWAERLPYLSFQRVGIRMKPILEAGPHNATNAGDSCVTLWALRRKDTSDFQNASYWMPEGYGNHVRSDFCSCLVERGRLGYLRESQVTQNWLKDKK